MSQGELNELQLTMLDSIRMALDTIAEAHQQYSSGQKHVPDERRAELAANLFVELGDDDSQAKCLVNIARLAAQRYKDGPHHQQWWYVGVHLGECECSDSLARDMIEQFMSGLTYGRTKQDRPVTVYGRYASKWKQHLLQFTGVST